MNLREALERLLAGRDFDEAEARALLESLTRADVAAAMAGALLAALRAYTRGGAFASGEEHEKGTLEPGMLADLQVYDGDPVDEPDGDADHLHPRVVLLGGAPVFGRF